MTTRATYRERVKRGVKLLDEYVPSWRDKIDCKVLDIGSAHCCILGQVYEDNKDNVTGYYYGICTIPELDRDSGLKYGFITYAHEGFDILNDLWRKQVCANK